MPNIKSAIKRVKTSKTKTLQNNMAKSALKTTVKKAKQAIESGSDNVQAAFKSAVKSIDKAAAKGLLHKNNAARKKSQLQSDFSKITK